MHFRESEKSKFFAKRVEGGGGMLPNHQGTSVSTLTLGNATPTTKHFENTGLNYTLLPLANKLHMMYSCFLIVE